MTEPDTQAAVPETPSDSYETDSTAADITATGDGRRATWFERLIWLGVATVYGPVVVEVAHEWMVDERYSHGWLILPVSLGLVWMQKARLATTPIKGTSFGLIWIVLGLSVHGMGWFLRFPHVGIWSMVMVVSGVVLALYGRGVWRIVRFAVLFALFAGTFPNRLIEPINLKIQSVSAAGAAHVMSFAGYTVMREGNRIEIPGHVVEVADICSGYKKTVALLAFAFLYGFVMSASPMRRVILCLSAFVIGAIANVGRVAGLIAVTAARGAEGLHRAHDPAEMVSLVGAFFLFLALGKILGCKLPEQL